mmetsp:Transcript_3574/g.3535  ORF Transcript_3574/g.3535 Transcript_3574/m.3535 type:complete len:92 (+) Transcript_3574:458-733(+)
MSYKTETTPEKKSFGCKSGTKNYKNEVLLEIIDKHLPTSEEEWHIVTAQYKKASGENVPRDSSDVKKHFFSKLCNNGTKPTGDSGNSIIER